MLSPAGRPRQGRTPELSPGGPGEALQLPVLRRPCFFPPRAPSLSPKSSLSPTPSSRPLFRGDRAARSGAPAASPITESTPLGARAFALPTPVKNEAMSASCPRPPPPPRTAASAARLASQVPLSGASARGGLSQADGSQAAAARHTRVAMRRCSARQPPPDGMSRAPVPVRVRLA